MVQEAGSAASAAAPGELVPIRDYQPRAASRFPGFLSLQYFCRTHRKRLALAGAVVMARGRLHVDPQRFDACWHEIAREQTLKRFA